MKRPLFFGFVLLALCGGAWGEPSVSTPLFHQGQTRLSLGAGYGSLNNQNYGIVGLGAGYYLIDGLEAGLDSEAWLGSKPHIYTLSPGLRYVIYQWEQLKPYVGAFYKRSLYDSLSPLDSAGARAGIVTPLSTHTYLSAGIVYEHYYRCNSTLYGDCDLTYPEIGFSFAY
jgi:hypothetical protein